MSLTLITFGIAFLLVSATALLLTGQSTARERLTAVIEPDRKRASLLSGVRNSGLSLKSLLEHFDRLMPKSKAEQGVMKTRLTRAGYRSPSAAKTLYGSKVLLPITLCGLLLVSGLAGDSIMFYVMALGLGFLAPDFWLGRQIKKRQALIRRGLPDVLDLMVVCIEAGLSLDQAVVRSSQELASAYPALCDELQIVILEQRAGRGRAEAWKDLGDRTDVDTLRALVSVLVQAEQFGTSVGRTLRTHSDTLRTMRIQKIEELAAKTTVKLIFPLVLFIFPSLFVVVLGPAVITMIESFARMNAK